MITFFRKIISFFICLVGVLLPWRLRIIYAEVIGWFSQVFFGAYVRSLKLILHLLKTERR